MPFANLPDPTSPGFPALLSIMAGFFSAYLGVGFGLFIYLAVLLGELY